ncbi:MAG: DUF2207 domain-containing protein [Propionibacteriaceae bacterium]|nr:DUF2207 domain-containing protein [Propionibacteriaceae bacterium]
MKRIGFLLAAFAVVVLQLVGASSARADGEYIRHLDVTYAVQADGTVDVRYEVQWHFAETGRHGIILNFASRESWENDRSKDVVYHLSDFRVSSPDAPAQFTQSTEGEGSEEAQSLRIGDPDKTLTSKDATYVVEYTMAGALRTFDGAPQLFWDVNSPNLPEVRSFSATVTAPDGVTRARCLVGPEECTATITNGTATYSHDGGPGVTSVVAEFPAGSVANAEPILEDRRITFRELRGLTTNVTVQADGSAAVHERLEMAFPPSGSGQYVHLEVMQRLPWSEQLDQVLSFSNLEVRDEAGALIEHRLDLPAPERSASGGNLWFNGSDSQVTGDLRTFDITYTLHGAAGVQGDLAHLRMPILLTYSTNLVDGQVTWELPADVLEAACLEVRYYPRGIGQPCQLQAAVDGNTITMDAAALRGISPRTFTDFTFPASSLTSHEPLVESLDHTADQRRELGLWLGGGGALALIGAAFAGARAGGRRDQRYATVAPGLVGAPNVTKPASRKDIIPVAFTPPKLLVSQAGLLLHRAFRPEHLAATLVSLAVQGNVLLGSKPLVVQRVENGPPTKGVESEVFQQATLDGKKLSEKRARKMRTRMERAAEREVRDSGWFQKDAKAGRSILLVLGPILPAVAYWAWFIFIGNPLPDGGAWVGLGLTVGGLVGVVLAAIMVFSPALTADGTAMLDQIKGFRQYIATAEAHQLNFEADRDIFRRYLPWAVLFGLTDRWTEVCRQWAAEGHIDQLDTTFWVGGASFDNFGREMSRFSSAVASTSAPPASSSGGSGGSSGFSGGSSGGGGGGGTSGSSW